MTLDTTDAYCLANAERVLPTEVVRGSSHSGNVSGQELAALDCLDISSSDYVPSALLLGAMRLADLWGDMAPGIARVTKSPAERVGLADRGAIETGRRADLIRFQNQCGMPVLRGVFSQGRQAG